MTIIKKISVLGFSAVILVILAAAPSAQQNHPLSEIYPIDEDLNMSDQEVFNASKISLNDGIGSTGLVLEGYKITHEGNGQSLTLDYSNDEWDIENSDLNLNNNNLAGFFGSSCQSGYFVTDIANDGTIDCVNVTGEVQESYINRGGDTLTGDLDLSGNDLEDESTVVWDTSSGYVPSSQVQDSWIDEGTADVSGNAITWNSGSNQLAIDWSDANNLDSNGDVSGLTDVDTDELSEGADNLYFTDSRAQSAVSANDVNLENVRNVDLDSTAGSYLGYNINNENFNVDASSVLGSGNDLDSDGDVSGLTDVDTDDLSEGADNLYFTDARAQDAVSASDVGLGSVEDIAVSTVGGSALSWDSNNEELDVNTGNGITVSGGSLTLSASDFDSSGSISTDAVGNNEIDNDANIDLGTLDVSGGSVGDGTQNGLTVDSNGNLYFDGSLNFPGDVNTISAQQLNGSIVPDRDDDQNLGSGSNRWNNLYVASRIYDGTNDNFFENGDLGSGQRITGIDSDGSISTTTIDHSNLNGVNRGSHHGVGSGLQWDANDDIALNAADLDSSGNIDDFSGADDLDGAGDVSSLSDVTTTDLSEGNNEYHTDSRARSAVEGTSDLTDLSSGQTGSNNYVAASDGSGNVNWDDPESLVHSKYTDENAQDAAASALTGSGAANVNYDDGADTITVSSSNTQLDDQAAQDDVDMNGYDVTSNNGEICVGQYC